MNDADAVTFPLVPGATGYRVYGGPLHPDMGYTVLDADGKVVEVIPPVDPIIVEPRKG